MMEQLDLITRRYESACKAVELCEQTIAELRRRIVNLEIAKRQYEDDYKQQRKAVGQTVSELKSLNDAYVRENQRLKKRLQELAHGAS